MMSREVMKLALEALEYIYEGANNQGPHTGISWRCVSKKAAPVITALREALAEQPAQQEPVFRFQMQLKPGWGSQYPSPCVIGDPDLNSLFGKIGDVVTFYTSPPAQRKPLTDEMVLAAARMLSDRQAAACNVDCGDMWKLHGNDFIDDACAALEAAHGIGEKK